MEKLAAQGIVTGWFKAVIPSLRSAVGLAQLLLLR